MPKYDAKVSLNQAATEALIDEIKSAATAIENEFAAAQYIATRLGGQWRNGRAEIGFWLPQLNGIEGGTKRPFLEIFRPPDDFDIKAETQTVQFARHRVPLVEDGDLYWGVIEGMQVGSRGQIGDFYQLTYQTDDAWHIVHDSMAASLPFGAFAPAELYDIEGMLASRQDSAHFHNQLDTLPDPDGVNRVQAPINILQIHIKSASSEGTLSGLTAVYGRIAQKLQSNQPLTPTEENFANYDAVQLMPIEPTIEFEGQASFWNPMVKQSTDSTVMVSLKRPSMTNWGYDVVIHGGAAVNPALLGSRRPDELLDFIVTLHNFPNKPIKVLFDIVYGHIDNQAIGLLNGRFFAGANMYGQNVNFLDSMVRAMLLEMQRRKHNYGVDGVRVDGAQDFKNWDPETDTMWHDDDYLRLMNDLEQEVAGVNYRPWMIFEDGRPWPRDDWELSSTYREVTKQMPNVWQWGPLTFAHNTPFLFTFWISKWWRIQEITQVGGRWITGCANHDTLRRGTQVPLDARINTYLGDTLPDIFMKAYDNPAAKLFDYACMPGIPMDFINASMRAPWSFVRNTDDKYGVKVVSEESRFLHWVVNEDRFNATWAFTRLKGMGFTQLSELRRFLNMLDHTVQATEYDLAVVAELLQRVTPTLVGAPFSVPKLKQIARAWMDDVHEFCNISHYTDQLDPAKTAYNRELRAFRQKRPWLQNDFQDGDVFDYLRPVDGSVVFYSLRTSPNQDEQLLFVANMEGAPKAVTPLALPIPNLAHDGWQVVLSTLDLQVSTPSEPISLKDSEGVVFVRQT